MTAHLHLLAAVKVTRKIAEVRLVTRRVWIEAALWRSGLSALDRWSCRIFRWGFRVTTPALGCGAGVWL